MISSQPGKLAKKCFKKLKRLIMNETVDRKSCSKILRNTELI